jgi:hypothetical protein
MRHFVATTAAALLLTAGALPALAQEKPQALGAPTDGTYECGKISGSMYISLGNIRIAGDTYSGVTDDARAQSFGVNADNTLSFSGGLEGFEAQSIDDVRLFQSTTGAQVLAVYYTSPTGFSEVMDCELL